MSDMLQFIATISAALFTGAALYINLVEHPARMSLDTRAAATQWAPSYRRATWMQAPLAVVSLFSGTASWYLTGERHWLIAAILIGAVVPFTLLVIEPTNRALFEPGRDLASEETRALLVRWGRLHAVRTGLSIWAMLIYLWHLVTG